MGLLGAETTTHTHHSTTFQTLPSAAVFLMLKTEMIWRRMVMLASILVILTPDPSDHLDLFDPRSEWSAVDGSGRVTSWGKSWEMAGDGSTHQPTILPTKFPLSPDFVLLTNLFLLPYQGLHFCHTLFFAPTP